MNNKRLLYISHISFWLIYLAISSWIFSNFLDLQASVSRSFANGIPLFVLVYINIWNINTFFEKKKITKAILIAIGLIIIFTPIRYYINAITYFQTDFGFTDKKILLLGIVITNLLMIVFSSFYQILVNRFEKNKRQSEEIRVFQSAQLQYLRSQINPHFLFNTLNNIYSLALTKSDKTPKMVLKLADILRYVVYQDDNKLVLLNDEVKLIHHFIDLTKMSFEEAPNIKINVEGDTENLYIEPMIILPIIENCFKHSDINTNENGYIVIELSVTNANLILITKNSKNVALKQKDDVGGVGLENIKKRLLLTHKNNHCIDIINKENSFEVQLNLDLKNEKT